MRQQLRLAGRHGMGTASLSGSDAGVCARSCLQVYKGEQGRYSKSIFFFQSPGAQIYQFQQFKTSHVQVQGSRRPGRSTVL